MTSDLISIIIPTIGRSTQLDALLHSITCSTYKHFEIIIVDQNRTEIADDVILKHKDVLPIKHIKANFVGLSKARNHGLQFAKGQYLFFPDDDAELFPETLALFIENLRSTHADVVFGKCVDRTLADSAGIFSDKSSYLSLKRHKNMSMETTMFIRKDTFSKFLFDESFGIGTFYGAEEGYDLLLRMLYEKVIIFYTPEINIYHPNKVINHADSLAIRRVFSYRCGFGKLCLKHKLYLKLLSRIVLVIGFIPFSFLFARNKTRYYCAELLGILCGIIIR